MCSAKPTSRHWWYHMYHPLGKDDRGSMGGIANTTTADAYGSDSMITHAGGTPGIYRSVGDN